MIFLYHNKYIMNIEDTIISRSKVKSDKSDLILSGHNSKQFSSKCMTYLK